MIFLSDVNKMINTLTEHGIDVFKEDYVIMAHPNTTFFPGELWPLEIVLDDQVPHGVSYLMKRITVQQVVDKSVE